MNVLPSALQTLIDELGKLPGVGPRTAERYAFYLLKQDSSIARELSKAIAQVHEHVAYCQKTFALVEAGQEISPLYSDPRRNKKIVAVVEDPFDIVAIEKTGQFKGTYHVLGGALSPIDGIGPEQLHVKELIERIKEDKVNEIILATNGSVEGESTALYIQKQLEGIDISITRLARGLPAGLDLEYADQITLTRALEGRHAL